MAKLKSMSLTKVSDIAGISAAYESMGKSSDIDTDYPVVEIETSRINDFKRNAFSVREDDPTFKALLKSIKEEGRNITPARVFKNPNGKYELVYGHRRKRACEILGLKLRCEVVPPMDEDTRAIQAADENIHRVNIPVYEKAKSISMKYEAIKNMKARGEGAQYEIEENNDDVSDNLKGKTADILSENFAISSRSIHRLNRIASLTEDLGYLVGTRFLTPSAAIELADLDKECQEALYNILSADEIKLSAAKAGKLKDMALKKKLNPENIKAVVEAKDSKKSKKEPETEPEMEAPATDDSYLVLPKDILKRYIPDYVMQSEYEEIIYKALIKYYKDDVNVYEDVTADDLEAPAESTKKFVQPPRKEKKQ